MKISLLILAGLLLKKNSVKAFSLTTSTNEIENDNANADADEVFAEREDFWTRELGKSIGRFIRIYMHVMTPHI